MGGQITSGLGGLMDVEGSLSSELSSAEDSLPWEFSSAEESLPSESISGRCIISGIEQAKGCEN